MALVRPSGDGAMANGDLDIREIGRDHHNRRRIGIRREPAQHAAGQILAVIVDHHGAELTGRDVGHRVRRNDRHLEPGALTRIDDAREHPQGEGVALLGIEHLPKARLGVVE